MTEPKWLYEEGDLSKIAKHQTERVDRGFSDYDWWNFDLFLSKIIIEGLIKFRDEGMGYPGSLPSKEAWDKILNDMIEGLTLHVEDKLDGMVEDESEPLGWRYDEKLFKKNYAKYKKAMRLFAQYHSNLWD